MIKMVPFKKFIFWVWTIPGNIQGFLLAVLRLVVTVLSLWP